MEEVFRQEKKYLISMEEFYRAGGQFDALLHEDPHNGAHGYRIRSLYFDTLSDRDFHEKEDGVELRRKLRLRLYDPRGDFAMLEMKQKQGMYQKKRSLRLAREDAQRVARGDYTPLAESTDPFAQECYAVLQCHTYRPKTVVEYRRKAFIAKENRIRITLDHQIAASESHLDPFDPALVLNPVLDPWLAVLEVKYNGFLLSYIREIINSCNRSELSVSKYCLARSASMHYYF